MNAFVIEAVPARAARVFAEAIEVLFAFVGEDVVLAGNVENVADFCIAKNLADGIKLRCLREVR